MERSDLQEFLLKEPFEPVRIKLVNGDYFDVFDSQTTAVRRRSVFIALPDMNWVMFALDKINSVESLIADYAAGPSPEPEGG